MTEIIAFPDVEAWAVAHLAAQLAARDEPYADAVTVATRTPNPLTGRAVVVRRDGGPRLDLVRERARLGIRVHAPVETDAIDLAALCRALLEAAPGAGPVLGVTYASGPYALPEESGTFARYFTVELLVRGSAI
ncbi:MAG: hypothetical protein AB7I24_08235 [Candidatus Nanopelagicales bacterium]|jgi:hypothetical protein